MSEEACWVWVIITFGFAVAAGFFSYGLTGLAETPTSISVGTTILSASGILTLSGYKFFAMKRKRK